VGGFERALFIPELFTKVSTEVIFSFQHSHLYLTQMKRHFITPSDCKRAASVYARYRMLDEGQNDDERLSAFVLLLQ